MASLRKASTIISEGKRNDNPAAGVFIKGLISMPANLLTTEEMEELYKKYSIQINVDQSKKIMFGLMVYQGVTLGELMRLQAKHIKLKDGKIFIKGTNEPVNDYWICMPVRSSNCNRTLVKTSSKKGSYL